MKNKDKQISTRLAVATCALLGSQAAAPVLAQEAKPWELDLALLYYGESDERVQDASLNVLAKRLFADQRSLSLNLTVDTLTGASASGAIALDRPQTFTSPSGNAVYTTPTGEIPLDDTFLDTRVAFSATWSQPLGRLYKGIVGISFSDEYDYTHLGANFGLERDFFKRNTTLSLGVAFSQDDLDPVGGAPIPLAHMRDVGDPSSKRGSDSKDVLDVLIGVTQVIDINTVVRVNYSFSDSSGYLNDPYKLLSIVDPITGDTLNRTPAPGAIGADGEYVYESRPDGRAKHSLYGQVKRYLGGKVLDVSYRFMTDDWDIASHTVDARLRWPLNDRAYLEPHVRYYMQSEAEFYRASLVAGQPLPRYASADFRLGDFDAFTLGLKYGSKTRSGNEWSARVEYYNQSGAVPSNQIIGNQSSREQYPDLSALILQFSYQFKF